MLDVNIEKILPVTAVRDALNKIIDEVEESDELYVVTKNGKPSAIIVGVHHLEKLTGISHKEIMPEEPEEEKETTMPESPDVKTPEESIPTAVPIATSTTEPTPMDSTPATTSPMADATTPDTDFDDLFSSPEPSMVEPMPANTQVPPAPLPTEPVMSQLTPAEPAISADQPAMATPIQPQPVQPQVEPVTAPAADTANNAAATPATPPTNQANLPQ